MPSGYTDTLYRGDQTFFEFASRCAYAFGALIDFRDHAEPPTIEEALERMTAEPDLYEARELKKEEERYHRLLNMSEEEREAEFGRVVKEVHERNRQEILEKQARETRYRDMIERVANWQPPTDEHKNLKKFMLDQLQESIAFDCKPYVESAPLSATIWHSIEFVKSEERIKRLREELESARERNEGRVKWTRELLESISE